MCTCVCIHVCMHACVGPRLTDKTKDDRTEADEEGADGSLGPIPVPTVTALAAGDTAKGQEVPAPEGQSQPFTARLTELEPG